MTDRFKADAATMNALIDGLGALALVVFSRMPAEMCEGAAKDFAELAAGAEHRGEIILETLLMDLHRAAVTAAT